MTLSRHLFTAIVPGWKGRDLGRVWSLRQKLFFLLSLIVLEAFALGKHARPFRMLTQRGREALLDRMLAHRSPYVRRLVRWWKQLALVTAC